MNECTAQVTLFKSTSLERTIQVQREEKLEANQKMRKEISKELIGHNKWAMTFKKIETFSVFQKGFFFSHWNRMKTVVFIIERCFDGDSEVMFCYCLAFTPIFFLFFHTIYFTISLFLLLLLFLFLLIHHHRLLYLLLIFLNRMRKTQILHKSNDYKNAVPITFRRISFTTISQCFRSNERKKNNFRCLLSLQC